MSISVFDQIKQTTSSQFTFITTQKFKVETDENWSLCVGGPNEANLFLPKRWLDQIDGRMNHRHHHLPFPGHAVATYLETSVTRFGEFSPLWHNFTSHGQIFEAFFSIIQNLILLWQKCFAIGQFFI